MRGMDLQDNQGEVRRAVSGSGKARIGRAWIQKNRGVAFAVRHGRDWSGAVRLGEDLQNTYGGDR